MMRAARKPLAHIVVGVAFEFERNALGQKRAETLSGRAGELEADGVVRQTGRAVLARDLAATASRPPCGARCGSAA